MLPAQMSPWQLESVLDVPRSLHINFHQNWVSNSWDITVITTFTGGCVIWELESNAKHSFQLSCSWSWSWAWQKLREEITEFASWLPSVYSFFVIWVNLPNSNCLPYAKLFLLVCRRKITYRLSIFNFLIFHMPYGFPVNLASETYLMIL